MFYGGVGSRSFRPYICVRLPTKPPSKTNKTAARATAPSWTRPRPWCAGAMAAGPGAARVRMYRVCMPPFTARVLYFICVYVHIAIYRATLCIYFKQLLHHRPRRERRGLPLQGPKRPGVHRPGLRGQGRARQHGGARGGQGAVPGVGRRRDDRAHLPPRAGAGGPARLVPAVGQGGWVGVGEGGWGVVFFLWGGGWIWRGYRRGNGRTDVRRNQEMNGPPYPTQSLQDKTIDK